MSENNPEKNLQFDKAEFETEKAPAVCASCGAALSGKYFSVNLQSMCEKCTDEVRASLARPSTTRDVIKSILFGIGAGIAGSLIYFAVLKFTGYEIGLIAILVGYLVGRAVMVGSEYRGGLKYRVIAVAITYIAIVSTYIPLVIEGIKEHQRTTEAGIPAAPGVSNAQTPTPAQPAEKQIKQDTKKAKPEIPAQVTAEKMTFGQAVIGLAVLAGYVLILPFLAGASNIIGIFIIGLALFEAARRTAKPKIEIEGPFGIHA